MPRTLLFRVMQRLARSRVTRNRTLSARTKQCSHLLTKKIRTFLPKSVSIVHLDRNPQSILNVLRLKILYRNWSFVSVSTKCAVSSRIRRRSLIEWKLRGEIGRFVRQKFIIRIAWSTRILTPRNHFVDPSFASLLLTNDKIDKNWNHPIAPSHAINLKFSVI